MRPRLTIMLVAALVSVAIGLVPAAPSAATSSYEHLDPGGPARLFERVPVNVVFVGYGEQQVDAHRLVATLPRTYKPIVRSRAFYGVEEQVGLTYTYDFHPSFTGSAYENRFFAELARLSRPAPLTIEQLDYNQQKRNVLEIGRNYQIDAPSVERWLAFNPPAGVNTSHNTVFFINWFGRPDFRFHVYTKTDEPDPDTGHNFGAERSSRKIIAWGGTTANDEESGLGAARRVWFHDLSAGPEQWTANWNVDDRDLDGNGVEDYRMPPAWEYRTGGYRAPAALGPDLAKITRYVALDLLFTTSPLYPVELPPSEPPRSINLDHNIYEGWPGVDASLRYLKPGLVLAELNELRWRNTLDHDNQDLAYRGDAKRCYLLQLDGTPCYPVLGYPPSANNFLFNTFHLRETQDDQGRVDYELPVFSYAVGPGVGSPALGYADDNFRDGTQSYVFAFVSPDIVDSGYGLTTTLIHEVGHHLGLSHPHDGYDSASGRQFAAAGPFYFVWAGDESNSMMSYIDLNWDFSQFDRDNMNRFVTAAYVEAANRLAGEVLARPDPSRALGELGQADDLIGRAEAELARHKYHAALALAGTAYERAALGASQVGVSVAALTAALSADAEAARASGPVHDQGVFIDTLDPDGPRSKP